MYLPSLNCYNNISENWKVLFGVLFPGILGSYRSSKENEQKFAKKYFCIFSKNEGAVFISPTLSTDVVLLERKEEFFSL
jgi:hypothetical protein